MLTTTRPTPTTVSYTVSTRSNPGTLTSRLTTIALVLLRLTAGLLILAALLLEFNTLATTAGESPSWLPTWLSTSYLPSHDRHPPNQATIPKDPLPIPLPPLLRAAIYTLTLYLVLLKGYTSESLLVVRGLGVQTATAGKSFLWGGGGGSTRFIPASRVQDIFIHEAFRGFEVRFYLCIVVEGEEGVVVVFPVSFLSSFPDEFFHFIFFYF